MVKGDLKLNQMESEDVRNTILKIKFSVERGFINHWDRMNWLGDRDGETARWAAQRSKEVERVKEAEGHGIE